MENTSLILVAGKIYVSAGKQDEFVRLSTDAVSQARKLPRCIDFAVSVDPLEPDRVNVFELWETEQALLDFRGQGPTTDLLTLIENVDVAQYNV